jgi:hypothetical protein
MSYPAGEEPKKKCPTLCGAFVARPGLVRRSAALDPSALSITQETHAWLRQGSFCFPPPLAQASLARVVEKQNPSARLMGFLLPDLDSNQDKQNQNLSYYHYTIGQ